MKDKRKPPTKGKLLVAEPLLGDPNFDRTVVLMTDHNEEGSVGFVLNRPTDAYLHQLIEGFGEKQHPIHIGGPVQQDNLFYLHKKGALIPNSHQIGEELYWGGDVEPLKELLKVGLVEPEEIRFYLGYSGWGKGQLMDELGQDSWLVLDAALIDVFEDKPEDMWPKILRALGEQYALWVNTPADPNLN